MTAETNTTDHKGLIGRVSAFIGVIDRYTKILQEDKGDFNILDALGITEKERYHSNIIAEILNPDGRHGLSTAGLCHFIELLKGIAEKANHAKPVKNAGGPIENAGILQDWKCKDTRVDTECIGFHGRVDILLRDGSNKHTIVIENKIWSIEREKQLARYRKDYPQALLVFLTLDGEESVTACAKNDYLALSYKKEGVEGWIQKCEQAARYPAVRESLIQYRKTIQSLTGEGSNVMKEELCKIITADKESLRAALEIQELEIYEMLWEKKVIPTLKKYAKKRGLKFHKDEDGKSLRQAGYAFSFYSTESKACRIWFAFEYSQMDNLYYGFCYDTNETVPKKVQDTFSKILSQSGNGSAWKQGDGWLLYRYMNQEFRHWTVDMWSEFYDPTTSKTLQRVEKALDELLRIVDKHNIAL